MVLYTGLCTTSALGGFHLACSGRRVPVDLMRIGDKMISRAKIDRNIDRILELRSRGLSQQDVASKLKIDRTFISRLETLGEVRKGGRIGIVGFPLGNRDELEAVCREEGVDFILLMNDEQRWAFVEEKSGIELVNTVMEMAAELRDYSTVILLGSDKRLRVFEALLDKETISIVLGQSPIIGDRTYDPDELRRLLRSIRGS